jgi:hypothetical protein
LTKIKDLNPEYIIEDPEKEIPGAVNEFKDWYLEVRKYSKDLVDLLIKNSKITNWPNGFNSKCKINLNKSYFQKLKCKKTINNLFIKLI